MDARLETAAEVNGQFVRLLVIAGGFDAFARGHILASSSILNER
jgi:hypothetical protein